MIPSRRLVLLVAFLSVPLLLSGLTRTTADVALLANLLLLASPQAQSRREPEINAGHHRCPPTTGPHRVGHLTRFPRPQFKSLRQSIHSAQRSGIIVQVNLQRIR